MSGTKNDEIKCLKYKMYTKPFLESAVDEIVRMKLNYELLTGNDILAILYIVWDEDEESQIVNACQADFDDTLKKYQVENTYLQCDLKAYVNDD